MAENNTESKVPKHLYIIGGLALLWNAIGAMDFVMTTSRNPEYMAQLTPEQVAYCYGFPVWLVVSWSLGVWASVLATISLLFRSDVAVHLYIASLAGMCVHFLYMYVFTNGKEMFGAGAMVMSLVVFAMAVALVIYSRAMRDRGVLT